MSTTTSAYNIAMQRLDMPSRIRRLPIDERGYPVPRFVRWIDGKPDFRIADYTFRARAYRQRLCWICGEPLGRHLAFPIGPMCAFNRVTSEPASHLDCAHFTVRACPFLTQPNRARNEEGLPENRSIPGTSIARNPGVTAIWITDHYKAFRVANGELFRLGDPLSIKWWSRGRPATREEIVASINSGLPALRESAAAQGREAREALEREIARGWALVEAPRAAPPEAQ